MPANCSEVKTEMIIAHQKKKREDAKRVKAREAMRKYEEERKAAEVTQFRSTARSADHLSVDHSNKAPHARFCGRQKSSEAIPREPKPCAIFACDESGNTYIH